MNGFLQARKTRHSRGIVLSELLLVMVIVAMLAAVLGSSLRRVREKTYITIDLANFRQILKASAIYNSDNNDHMAHPTWGADLSGPDGWAYLTSNQGRVPGAANFPGTCAGRDLNSAQFTNQLAFFKKGQVTQYLEDGVKTTWCPKDVANRRRTSGNAMYTAWLARPVKVTTYGWNGTIGGYLGPRAVNLNGKTYKISQFKTTDWQMWEADETDAFNFNDAAASAEDSPPSRRHTGIKDFRGLVSRQISGGAVIGQFDGSGNLVRWPKVYDVFSRNLLPSLAKNGPGYEP